MNETVLTVTHQSSKRISYLNRILNIHVPSGIGYGGEHDISADYEWRGMSSADCYFERPLQGSLLTFYLQMQS